MQLKPGSDLQNGKYRIIKTLGQGGFGITYLAEQTGLHRKVAIKEFFMKDCCERDGTKSRVTVGTGRQGELVSKFRRKFIREAQLIAQFNHPNIIRIHDVFEENGTAYYVMEFLTGGSLATNVQQKGPLSEEKALSCIREVSEALNYIHRRNSLHFDVKPSNVMLNEDGRAVLIDFGASKHYDEAGQQTSSTPIGISKGYAPLEQYQQAEVGTFTPATDIYSLGATLYYLVTGQVPPEASIVNEDGLERPAGISNRVWNAIEASMQPRRKDRPQNVCDFLRLFDGELKTNSDDSEETVLTGTTSSASSDSSSAAASNLESPEDANAGPEKKKHSNGLIYGIVGGVAALLLVSLSLLIPRKPRQVDCILIDSQAECVAEFESGTSEREFSIEKNFDERWSYVGVPDWFTAKGTEGKIVLSLTANKTIEEREATLVFKKSGSEDELGKLTVRQKGVGVGSLRITSEPAGAHIWIDGKDTKKVTPDIIEGLVIGSHIVVLKLDGYENVKKTIAVVEGNKNLSCSMIEKQVSSDHLSVQQQDDYYFVGNMYYKCQEYSSAVNVFRAAAEAGHAKSQAMLATCYALGNGVETNLSEAYKWYRKAAEQGDASSQYLMGNFYEKGTIVKQDYTEARKWYQKAAEQGVEDAKKALEGINE